MQASLLPRNKV